MKLVKQLMFDAYSAEMIEAAKEAVKKEVSKSVKEILERARNNSPKAWRKEPKMDAETVIKFIVQRFGCLCGLGFNDEEYGDYMAYNHPELCLVCRMRDEDICKCWETYIREKSQDTKSDEVKSDDGAL